MRGKNTISSTQLSLTLTGLLILLIAAADGIFGVSFPLFGSAAVPSHIRSDKVDISGRIAMVEVMAGGRQQIRLVPDKPHDLWRGETDLDLRLIVPKSVQNLKPGDRVMLEARLSPLLKPLLPNGFDFAQYARNQGFGATGFVDALEVTGTGEAGFVANARYQIQQKLYTHLEERAAAVASAVLVGLRRGLSPDLRESFRASGLAHLLAISGLHMALFWGSIVACIRAGLALFPHLSSRYSSIKIATVAALPFGCFYLVISGMPISAIRAFLMLALVMVAILMVRRGVTLHNVALAAIAILVIAPQNLFHPAFQMSFAAVYALVVGWQAFSQRAHIYHRMPRILRYIAGIIIASILAAGASAPFVLHHFGVITIWSIAANLVGMPLMALLIIPFGALGLLLMPLGWEGLPLAVMGIGLDHLINVADYFSGKPLSRLSVPPPSRLVLIFFAGALLLPAILRDRWRYTALLSLLAALVIWAVTPQPIAVFTAFYNRNIAAMKGADGAVYFSHKKVNDFTSSILLKPLGAGSGSYIGDRPCDDCGRGYGILPLQSGKILAFVWRDKGFDEACGKADLVLALRPAPEDCLTNPLIIDADDLRERGGVLIYDEGDGFRTRFTSGSN